MTRTRKPSEPPVAFQYTWDAYANCYRVWRIGWPGDSFEMVSIDKFHSLQWICQTFCIPLDEED